MSLAQIHEPKLYFCVSRVENYVRTFPSSTKFTQGWVGWVAIFKDIVIRRAGQVKLHVFLLWMIVKSTIWLQDSWWNYYDRWDTTYSCNSNDQYTYLQCIAENLWSVWHVLEVSNMILWSTFANTRSMCHCQSHDLLKALSTKNNS